MGMFSQKQEEPGEWAALPAEPFDRDGADELPEAPVADPLGVGLGAPGGASISVSVPTAASIVIPMPPAAGAAD